MRADTEVVEDTEIGAEKTEEAESVQEFGETAEEADTAQETSKDGYVEDDLTSADAHTVHKIDNGKEAASAQDAFYSDISRNTT